MTKNAAAKTGAAQLKRLRRACLAMIEDDPTTYFRPPYVGAAGWVGVELSRIDDEQLGALVREAHAVIVAKDRRSPGRRRDSTGRHRSGA